MSKLGTAAFIGKSGHHYEFNIYTLDAHFKPGHAGVYIITARTDTEHGHHKHHKILIGDSEDLSTLLQDHPQQDRLSAEGANCICVHATQDTAARERIIADLVAHYPELTAGD